MSEHEIKIGAQVDTNDFSSLIRALKQVEEQATKAANSLSRMGMAAAGAGGSGTTGGVPNASSIGGAMGAAAGTTGNRLPILNMTRAIREDFTITMRTFDEFANRFRTLMTTLSTGAPTSSRALSSLGLLDAKGRPIERGAGAGPAESGSGTADYTPPTSSGGGDGIARPPGGGGGGTSGGVPRDDRRPWDEMQDEARFRMAQMSLVKGGFSIVGAGASLYKHAGFSGLEEGARAQTFEATLQEAALTGDVSAMVAFQEMGGTEGIRSRYGYRTTSKVQRVASIGANIATAAGAGYGAYKGFQMLRAIRAARAASAAATAARAGSGVMAAAEGVAVAEAAAGATAAAEGVAVAEAAGAGAAAVAGAETGAVGGSLVPGAGTALGAVAGLATGIGAYYLMSGAESAVSSGITGAGTGIVDLMHGAAAADEQENMAKALALYQKQDPEKFRGLQLYSSKAQRGLAMTRRFTRMAAGTPESGGDVYDRLTQKAQQYNMMPEELAQMTMMPGAAFGSFGLEMGEGFAGLQQGGYDISRLSSPMMMMAEAQRRAGIDLREEYKPRGFSQFSAGENFTYRMENLAREAIGPGRSYLLEPTMQAAAQIAMQTGAGSTEAGFQNIINALSSGVSNELQLNTRVRGVQSLSQGMEGSLYGRSMTMERAGDYLKDLGIAESAQARLRISGLTMEQLKDPSYVKKVLSDFEPRSKDRPIADMEKFTQVSRTMLMDKINAYLIGYGTSTKTGKRLSQVGTSKFLETATEDEFEEIARGIVETQQEGGDVQGIKEALKFSVAKGEFKTPPRFTGGDKPGEAGGAGFAAVINAASQTEARLMGTASQSIQQFAEEVLKLAGNMTKSADAIKNIGAKFKEINQNAPKVMSNR